MSGRAYIKVVYLVVALCLTLLFGYCTYNDLYPAPNWNLEPKKTPESKGDGKKANMKNIQLSREVVDGVEKFVLFAGWPRSGSSILGSVMDAHPNMIIADEYSTLSRVHKNEMDKYMLFSGIYRMSYAAAMIPGKKRTKSNHPKGYTLAIPGLWQGNYTQLRVIGDKSGPDMSRKLLSPMHFASLYQKLHNIIQIPIHIIFLVRNPYDMVATAVLYRRSDNRRIKIDVDGKFNDSGFISLCAQRVFSYAALQGLKEEYAEKLPLLEIHLVDYVQHPREFLQSICNFLDVECPEDYLKFCIEKAFKSLSKSRELMAWDSELVAKFTNEVRKYPFFSRYSLDQD